MPVESDRSDIDLPDPNRRLHLCRVDVVYVVGRLGLPDRVLFLLRHAIDDRVRGHRARHRHEGVGVRREVGHLCALAGTRPLSARHVLQPHAGRGQGQVRMVRTQTGTAEKRRREQLMNGVTSRCWQ